MVHLDPWKPARRKAACPDRLGRQHPLQAAAPGQARDARSDEAAKQRRLFKRRIVRAGEHLFRPNGVVGQASLPVGKPIHAPDEERLQRATLMRRCGSPISRCCAPRKEKAAGARWSPIPAFPATSPSTGFLTAAQRRNDRAGSPAGSSASRHGAWSRSRRRRPHRTDSGAWILCRMTGRSSRCWQ